MSWSDYQNRSSVIFADECESDDIIDDVQPEIIDHLESCTSCSVLPILEDVDEDEVESVEQPNVINSLSKREITIDLCSAQHGQLIFTVNAAGSPPFQGSVSSLPISIANLVLISIDQVPPYPG